MSKHCGHIISYISLSHHHSAGRGAGTAGANALFCKIIHNCICIKTVWYTNDDLIDEVSAKEVAKEFVEINEYRIYFGQFEWLIVSDWWTFDVYITVCASVSVTYHSNSSVIIVFFECLEFCPHPIIPRLYSNPRAPPALACPLPLTVSGASERWWSIRFQLTTGRSSYSTHFWSHMKLLSKAKYLVRRHLCFEIIVTDYFANCFLMYLCY